VGIGIVLVVIAFALGAYLRRPRSEWQQTVLEACADVEELCNRRISVGCGCGGREEFPWLALHHVPHPAPVPIDQRNRFFPRWFEAAAR
jgi:hypothetical protein